MEGQENVSTSHHPLLPGLNMLDTQGGFNESAYMDHLTMLDKDYPWMNTDMLNMVHQSFFMYQKKATQVLMGLYAVTSLFGLVGNVLVLYVFARNRKMRTPTNAFLGNLVVCDLLVVCICMPFAVAYEVYSNWIYGDIMCRFVNFIQGLSVSSSVLSLTVISAERFYAIKKPFKARAFQSRSRIYKFICVIWAASIIIVLPVLFVRRSEEMEKILTVSISTCTEMWPTKYMKHLYNFTLLLLLYLGPVVFIAVGYMSIGMNLWKTDRLLHTNTRESEGIRATITGRRRVAKMLFVMALLFAVSWLPMHIMNLALDFLPEAYIQKKGLALRHLFSFLVWLAHANSSVNPICYCIMSQSFKRATVVELKQCCRRKAHFRRRSFVSLTMNSGSSGSTRVPTKRPNRNLRCGRDSWTAISMLPYRYERAPVCAV